jgi:hypothetical protein
MGTGGDVAERHARQRRIAAGLAGHGHDPGVGLADVVEAGEVRQLALLTQTGDRAHDEIGLDRAQGFPVEAEFLHHARGEVLHHHIDLLDQLAADFLGFGFAQVHAQGALAAVVLDEVAAAAFALHRQHARGVAGEGFDLDDVGAGLGHQPGAVGTGDIVAEIQDLDAVEQVFRCHAMDLVMEHRARLGSGAAAGSASISAHRTIGVKRRGAARAARMRGDAWVGEVQPWNCSI